MRYSSDTNSNRLRITRRSQTAVIDGEFRVNSSNNLEYWINGPSAWRRINGLPEKITFHGTWRLTREDDLELRVGRASYMPEALSGISRVTINGRIIAAEGGALVFESHSVDREGLQHVRLLKLTGAWGSDGANRITFSIGRRACPDILTLTGRWAINDNQQITYTHETYDLATKKKVLSSIEFSGYWQVSRVNRLAYIFAKSDTSRFDFKAQLETPNVYPASGVIKYRIGSGVRRRAAGGPAIVCLYGEWKISRKLGLIFEMEYEKGTFHSLSFGAKADMSRADRIELALIDERGAPVGGTLTVTHRFLKGLDAHMFARLKKIREEKGIEAGITIPF